MHRRNEKNHGYERLCPGDKRHPQGAGCDSNRHHMEKTSESNVDRSASFAAAAAAAVADADWHEENVEM